jgi:hypothetical protein
MFVAVCPSHPQFFAASLSTSNRSLNTSIVAQAPVIFICLKYKSYFLKFKNCVALIYFGFKYRLFFSKCRCLCCPVSTQPVIVLPFVAIYSQKFGRKSQKAPERMEKSNIRRPNFVNFSFKPFQHWRSWVASAIQ